MLTPLLPLQSNNHSFTGSEGDPEDGPAVAASIYAAVIVYAVRHLASEHCPEFKIIPPRRTIANLLLYRQ